MFGKKDKNTSSTSNLIDPASDAIILSLLNLIKNNKILLTTIVGGVCVGNSYLTADDVKSIMQFIASCVSEDKFTQFVDCVQNITTLDIDKIIECVKN